MDKILKLGVGITFFSLVACGQVQKQSCQLDESLSSKKVTTKISQSNQVVDVIMARRSIRKYKSQALESDKLHKILECGINAPNGMYKQSWEIRVVNTPEVMTDIEKGYTSFLKKKGAKRLSHPSFGAPCLIFIAHDTTYDLSQVDCGLLGENIILAAQSMSLGTCCLGGLVRYMKSEEAVNLLKRLNLSKSYELLYAIAVGYPDECPVAKPRNIEKIKFIE